jgi:hypothetical protein
MWGSNKRIHTYFIKKNLNIAEQCQWFFEISKTKYCNCKIRYIFIVRFEKIKCKFIKMQT